MYVDRLLDIRLIPSRVGYRRTARDRLPSQLQIYQPSGSCMALTQSNRDTIAHHCNCFSLPLAQFIWIPQKLCLSL